MVVWDHEDYLAEGYEQLNDESTYVEVKHFNGKTLCNLIEKSNNFFKRLNKKKIISEKELKYFSYSFKARLSSSRKIFVFCFIESPVKMIKNAFHFI